jgi:hypothetical protein
LHESTVSQNSPTAMNSSKLASFADHISTDMFSVTLTSSRLVCQGQSLQVKWPVQTQNLAVSENETRKMPKRTLSVRRTTGPTEKRCWKQQRWMEAVSIDYRMSWGVHLSCWSRLYIHMTRTTRMAHLSSVKHCK